jgi:tRNA threonylcarbamoyladenosine biosynthesis protein TsaB
MPAKLDLLGDRDRPLLAIDTSSAQAGVALFDGQSLSSRSWPAGRSHTATLLTEIHRILAAAELEVIDLAAVAVATGPGTFTGLRVGLGVAKGFHLATGVPLIGVSTLEATALPFAACGLPIVATVAAGRGRLTWAHYRSDGELVVESRPPRNGAAGEFAEEIGASGPLLVTGELDADQRDLVAGLAGVMLPPVVSSIRQPGAFAEIGWRRWRSGSSDAAAALEPVYPVH